MPPVRYAAFRPSSGLIATFVGGAAIGYGYRQYTRSNDGETADSLNPQSFTRYNLVHKQPVSATSSIFTLQHVAAGIGRQQGAQENDNGLGYIWNNCVWSVQVKQPQLQIARSYTPLPPRGIPDESQSGTSEQLPAAGDSAEQLRLLIRAEKNGEVSNYLHNLSPASEVSLRGPFVELQLPLDLREVIFIAGGTGIAPALQVAHILSQRSGARMHIFWNTRHQDECRGGESDAPTAAARSPGRRTASDWDPWSKISRLASFGTTGEQQSTGSGAITIPAGSSKDKNLVVQEIELLKATFRDADKDSLGRQGSLAIEYFVDDSNRFVKPKDVSRQMRHVAQEEEDQGREGEKKLILISGPEGFVDLWAGKKLWIGGKEVQGPLGGYFSHLGLTSRDWKVWKL